MFHSSAMRIVGKVVWVLTALAAINIGLKVFNYDFYMVDFIMARQNLEMAIRYMMLASGVISLAMFAMSCTSNCCSCGNNNSNVKM